MAVVKIKQLCILFSLPVISTKAMPLKLKRSRIVRKRIFHDISLAEVKGKVKNRLKLQPGGVKGGQMKSVPVRGVTPKRDGPMELGAFWSQKIHGKKS